MNGYITLTDSNSLNYIQLERRIFDYHSKGGELMIDSISVLEFERIQAFP